MLNNYLKIAFRNISRRKIYSAISISGLAIGIASCLMLFLVLRYEMSYDTFEKNHKRIYHIGTLDKFSDGGSEYTAGIPFPAIDAARLDFPQIKSGCIYANYGGQVSVIGKDPANPLSNKKFIEGSGVFFSDPEFMEIFGFKWLSGSPKLLAEPYVTVLSKKIAEKYFGNWKDAVGQFLKLDNAVVVKVGGIIEDLPSNTDFPLQIVTSFVTMKSNANVYTYRSDWNNTTSNFQVYMLIPENVSVAQVNSQLKDFSKKHRGSDGNSVRTHFLRGLNEIHYDSRLESLGDHITTKATLRTLSLIGILIIIMACINFINLSTAQAVSRSKEVGVRKVLGGNKLQLFKQMMGETALVVFLALVLAVIITLVSLPFVKHVVSINEPLSFISAEGIGFLLVTGLLVTMLSGIYPALILSGFKPALALKNKITSASIGGISLRRVLVVVQFGISQVLIIGTIIAISQMNFVRNADLGFNKSAVYVINGNSDSLIRARQPAFKEDLLKIPGVKSVSLCSDVPSSDNNWSTNFSFNNRPDEKFNLFLKFGDNDYVKTYGLHLVAGRNIDKTDTVKEGLINETLVSKLGLKHPEEALGKMMKFGGRTRGVEIVGVVKDFKTNSLKETIKPTLISSNFKTYYSVGIKLATNDISKTQSAIQRSWDKFFPEYANSSGFMDETIAKFYRQENQLSTLYKIFAGLAIFISCMGLYGLVSFMAVQKTKEVGIRKVLGASAANIVYLFSKEFTVLITIAFLVAAPLAYFMMNNWLNNFVYRIPIGVSVFALAVLISIIIAWLTVGYKALRAALAKPVTALKTE
ncbi:MAG: ABC transporter permease [Bacteroidetes bacterium]|nr:MAG: ABC transporter permease [Bacteroidota bacterium]